MKKSQGKSKTFRKTKITRALNALAEGKSLTESAAKVGLQPQSLRYRLKRLNVGSEELKQFKLHRADYFAAQAAKGYAVHEQMLQDFAESGIETATEAEKVRWYEAITRSGDAHYRNERLERGQSTSNIASLSTVVETIERRRTMDGQASATPESITEALLNTAGVTVDDTPSEEEGEG